MMFFGPFSSFFGPADWGCHDCITAGINDMTLSRYKLVSLAGGPIRRLVKPRMRTVSEKKNGKVLIRHRELVDTVQATACVIECPFGHRMDVDPQMISITAKLELRLKQLIRYPA